MRIFLRFLRHFAGRRKGAQQIVTKVTPAIAALEMLTSRGDVELISKPLAIIVGTGAAISGTLQESPMRKENDGASRKRTGRRASQRAGLHRKMLTASKVSVVQQEWHRVTRLRRLALRIGPAGQPVRPETVQHRLKINSYR